MRFLRTSAVALTAFFLLSGSVLSIHAATPPGCASPTPTPVSGPAIPIPAMQNVIFINEVLTTPQKPWVCDTTTVPAHPNPWIELYNPQTQALDLNAAHAYLYSDLSHSFIYLPTGDTIAPHGFLVLFPEDGFLLTNGAGKSINLRLQVGDQIIDSVQIPPLSIDQSYARVPDGSNTWQTTTSPTIGISNVIASPPPVTNQTGAGNSATETPAHKKSSQKSSSTTSSANGRGEAPAPNEGRQPAWPELQLPNKSSPPMPVPNKQLPTPVQAAPVPVWPKVALTFGTMALAGMLLWYRRIIAMIGTHGKAKKGYDTLLNKS